MLGLRFLRAEQVGELHADPERRDPAGDDRRAERRRQLHALGLERGERVAHRVGHHLPPRLDAQHELLAQARVGEARGPQLGLQPHEAGGEVALVEAARLRPLLGEAPGRRIHALLALQQPPVRLVEHRDDELVLAAEVVVDERVVDPRVPGDLAHAQRRVALLHQPAERGVEDPGLGLAELRLGARTWRRAQILLNDWFNHSFKL